MTTENVRIAVRDAQDSQTIAFLDNSAKEAIHFVKADLTRFFEGDSTVLQMTIDKKHELANHVSAGAKLSFVFKDKEYWLNIISSNDNGHQREVLAFSLSLELNREEMEAYSSNNSKSFEEYLKIIDPENTLEIGINEIKNKRVKIEWEGTQSKLGRIYSLANKMDAEVGFVTELNEDYSLKKQIINVFRKHDDKNQGLGQNRRGTTLRVGKDLSVINRQESLENFYSAIRGYGKDGVTIDNLVIEEKDEQGNVLYYSSRGQGTIWAPQARDRYPSKNNPGADGYLVEKKGETEYTTPESLKGYLLSELKKNSVLYVNYETEGYFGSDPGDTFSLEDTVYYDPPLYLEARVYEQTESLILGDSSSDKTTFSNFTEKQSEIDSSLLARVQALIEANKQLDYQLLSSGGTVFKNGQGTTTLTARIMDGLNEVTDKFEILWYKNNQLLNSSHSIIVNANDFIETAVFRYEAKDANENVKGGREVTVANVDDGEQGLPGADGEPTGVYVSDTPPEEPYDGMLWKNTSEDNEYLPGQSYIYDQNKNEWIVDTITAEAFVGKSFTGFEFISPFDREAEPTGSTWIKGESRISDGQTTTNWERYTRANGNIKETGFDSTQPGITLGRVVDYATGTRTGQYTLSSDALELMKVIAGEYREIKLEPGGLYQSAYGSNGVLQRGFSATDSGINYSDISIGTSHTLSKLGLITKTTDGTTQISGNYWYVSGANNLWVCVPNALNVRNADNTGFREVNALAFRQQSSHSLKENFEQVVTPEHALNEINKTDVVNWNFKNYEDTQTGIVINDDGDSPYYCPDDFVNNDNSRDDTSMLGYLILSVQALTKKNEELSDEIQRLKKKME